jgi:SAM-dependent methyltransferase
MQSSNVYAQISQPPNSPSDETPVSPIAVAEMRAYFAKRAPHYKAGNWQRRGLHAMERSAVEALPEGLDVAVDLGAGAGGSIDLLLTRAKKVFAVDISPEMLGNRPRRGIVLIADAHQLPMDAGSVDLVHARMSIHYMNLARLKAELLRVLAAAGYLLIISAFPYGKADESWFNERHRIKRKPHAYTPAVSTLIEELAPEFRLETEGTWTQRSLLSRTIKAQAGVAPADALRAHAEHVPPELRDLYRVTPLPDGDIEMFFRWAALTFRLSGSPCGDTRARP